MLALGDFLDTLIRAGVFLGVSLALGGLAWALVVLTPGLRRVAPAAVHRALAIIGAGAAIAAGGQVLLLVVKALVLSQAFGAGAVGEFAATLHVAAGTARIA